MRLARTFFLVAVLVSAVAAAYADEYSEVFAQMYGMARTLQQKQAVVSQVTARNDPASAPLLAFVLGDLLKTQPAVKDITDRAVLAAIVTDVCVALGNFRYVEAAPEVYRVIEEVSDPQARVEAVTALGKMRATAYVERLAQLLSSLNGRPTIDRVEGEKLAFACIVSLEKMRDPRGFAPIFFAMNAWYSDRVRDQARTSLALVVDDPTDSIREIVRTATPSQKLLAFRAELASKAPDARKLGVARYLLQVLLEYSAVDRSELLVLSEGRVLAMRTVISLGGRDASDAELFVRSYRIGPMDEKLVALAALGDNGTAAAAVALNEIVMTLNDRKASGSTETDIERLAQAAIAAIAKNGNALAAPSLMAVLANDLWSAGIRDLATKTLTSLK